MLTLLGGLNFAQIEQKCTKCIGSYRGFISWVNDLVCLDIFFRLSDDLTIICLGVLR